MKPDAGLVELRGDGRPVDASARGKLLNAGAVLVRGDELPSAAGLSVDHL
jgi:hypothetical protein